MTEEEKAKLDEIYAWMQERKVQQIAYPIDDVSVQAILERLGAPTFTGTSSSTLTQVYTDSGLDTVTGPRAYSGRLILVINGTTYQVPYLVNV
jgi:hypothetical protein